MVWQAVSLKAVSLKQNALCLCLVESLNLPTITTVCCHKAGPGKQGVTRCPWLVRNRHLCFLFLSPSVAPAPPESPVAGTFQLQPNGVPWAPVLSPEWTYLSSSGDTISFNLISTYASTPRCDSRRRNEVGEGLGSLFSFLRGRTVLKSSQTDG